MIARSPLDEARWGVPTVRGRISSLEELDTAETFCRNHSIRFLIVRAPTSRLNLVQNMEGRGFFLTGTLLRFSRSLERTFPAPMERGFRVCPVAADRADEVERTAARAFEGYQGHYRADPHLQPAECDQVYADWARRGTLVDEQSCCFGAEINGELVGFGLGRQMDDFVAEGPLYGVVPKARGKGIYRTLVLATMVWAREHGCRTMRLATQITNLASQRLWATLGFRIDGSEYTFHKWYE